jgi:transcriptional regulator with XRE-family HTH domain
MHIRRPRDLAAAIRAARHKKNLTQVELAQRLNVNRHWVQRFEAGESGMSLGLVLRALNELGLLMRIEETEFETKQMKSKLPISIDKIVDE